MAFVTDQIKTEQTDPFICSMCKIRGKTEEAIKTHILQVHLSEHFAEVDTTSGIQNSLSQIFKECSDQKMMKNGDHAWKLNKSENSTPLHSPLNGSHMPGKVNTTSPSINSVVSSSICNSQIPPMTSLTFQGVPQKFAFQNGTQQGTVNQQPNMEYITMKDQNGQHITIHNVSRVNSESVTAPVTYSVPLSNLNGGVLDVQPQPSYQQVIHTDTSNGLQTIGKVESESGNINGITVNYGNGANGIDNVQSMQPQQQTVSYQNESFPGSTSDTSNDFVCAKCTFRTDKIDHLETHLKEAHPASCVSFLCKHCNFKASNSRLFNIHLSVAHGNNTERSVVYKGAVATDSTSPKGSIQITTSSTPTSGTNGVASNGVANESMDVSVHNSVEINQSPVQVNGTFASDGVKGRERFKCEICETAFFPTAEALQEHKDQYHLGMRYQCFKCSASFSEGPELQVHYLTKHNISSNEYKVSQVDAVRVKFVVDETNKKFSCDLCGMRFTTCSAMYKHKRAKHLGMEYKCHLCNYTNGYRRGLKSHYETKHKNEPYNIPRTTKGALLKKPDKKGANDLESCTAIISPAAESPEMAAAKSRTVINASPALTPVNSNRATNSISPVTFTLPMSTPNTLTVSASTTTNGSALALQAQIPNQNNYGDQTISNSSLLANPTNTISLPSQPIPILNGGIVQHAVPQPLTNGNSLQLKNQQNGEKTTGNNKIMIIRQMAPNTPTTSVTPASACITTIVKSQDNKVALVPQQINNTTASMSPMVVNQNTNVIESQTPSSSLITNSTYKMDTSNNIQGNQNMILATSTPSSVASTYTPKEPTGNDNNLPHLPGATLTPQTNALSVLQINGASSNASLPSIQMAGQEISINLEGMSAESQNIASYQQNVHSTETPLSTFPNSLTTNNIPLPTAPSPLPEAISETTDVGAIANMNDHHDYGLHSLDNLKPISPTVLDTSSLNSMNMKSEDDTKEDRKLDEVDNEKPLTSDSCKASENSDVDWSQALALINGIPDTPYANKSIEINKSDSLNGLSANESKDSIASNGELKREYSEAESITEASQSCIMSGINDEYDTSNSIVKMKESHSRFAAFLKKARHSP